MPQHFKRLIITFVVVIGLFIGFRYLVTPKSFGEYGHYRGLALEENAAKQPHYAGRAICAKCHNDIVNQKDAGRHKPLACEMCHGPAYKHAQFADSTHTVKLPDSLKLLKHEEMMTRKFCLICHLKNAARTKILFDSIDKSVIKMVLITHPKEKVAKNPKADTLGCTECHNPHDPYP